MGPLMRTALILAAWAVICPSVSFSETETTDLTTIVQMALDANLALQSSRQGVQAAEAAKTAQQTRFFPTFNTQYDITRYDEARAINAFSRTPQTAYGWSVSVSQPVYLGRSLRNQYDIAAIGVSAAELNEKVSRQTIILQAKQAYYNVLRAGKLLSISKQTVTLIEAQADVADQFYQVGMTPLNDLLQAQVALANARQEEVVAGNDLDIARAQLNTLLRRPMEAELSLKDITAYEPFPEPLEKCFAAAEENRDEILLADRQVEIAQKEVDLARAAGRPTVSLKGSYYRNGDEPDVNGGEGVLDPDGWALAMVASWDFWQWRRPVYLATEKQRRLTQRKFEREDLLDRIRLEVNEAYLKTKEAEKNIATVEKAIEQARENVRINQERYREQVATSTDVLNAQTLLARTMTNYYGALYSFHANKAALLRAMGRKELE